VKLVEGYTFKTNKIGATLLSVVADDLISFLKENMDVFSWTHEDMPGIVRSIIEHRLNVDPKRKPVQQRRKVFDPEQNKAIMEAVDKLLAVGFIQEVYYPKWLTNFVMVKKSNGKWRMCVDFTDLN